MITVFYGYKFTMPTIGTSKATVTDTCSMWVGAEGKIDVMFEETIPRTGYLYLVKTKRTLSGNVVRITNPINEEEKETMTLVALFLMTRYGLDMDDWPNWWAITQRH